MRALEPNRGNFSADEQKIFENFFPEFEQLQKVLEILEYEDMKRI